MCQEWRHFINWDIVSCDRVTLFLEPGSNMITTSMLEEDDLVLVLLSMLAYKGIQRLILLYYVSKMFRALQLQSLLAYKIPIS
jgi:hypothetical protein